MADPQEILLCREASLSSMSLGHGLTQLRKYDFSATGYFYSSLSLLSIGLERLLKLIVIYDFRIQNGKFPDNKILRSYRHELVELIQKAEDLANLHKLKTTSFSCSEILVAEIIKLLSDFAVDSRYYNLDCLTGIKKDKSIEPLASWEQKINSKILNRHFRPNKRTIAQWEYLATKMEDLSYVRHTSEDGSEINTFKAYAAQAMVAETKQKYSMYYVYTIIRFLCEILSELEWKGQFYPFLREYFVVFLNPEKQYVLNKKSWNPLPPYRF